MEFKKWFNYGGIIQISVPDPTLCWKKTFKVLFCLYNKDVSALDACNMLSVLTA